MRLNPQKYYIYKEYKTSKKEKYESKEPSVLGILELIKYYEFKVVRFYISYIKYDANTKGNSEILSINIKLCRDYAKYRKLYKLLFYR